MGFPRRKQSSEQQSCLPRSPIKKVTELGFDPEFRVLSCTPPQGKILLLLGGAASRSSPSLPKEGQDSYPAGQLVTHATVAK